MKKYIKILMSLLISMFLNACGNINTNQTSMETVNEINTSNTETTTVSSTNHSETKTSNGELLTVGEMRVDEEGTIKLLGISNNKQENQSDKIIITITQVKILEFSNINPDFLKWLETQTNHHFSNRSTIYGIQVFYDIENKTDSNLTALEDNFIQSFIDSSGIESTIKVFPRNNAVNKISSHAKKKDQKVTFFTDEIPKFDENIRFISSKFYNWDIKPQITINDESVTFKVN